jgi:hypothetical protein
MRLLNNLQTTRYYFSWGFYLLDIDIRVPEKVELMVTNIKHAKTARGVTMASSDPQSTAPASPDPEGAGSGSPDHEGTGSVSPDLLGAGSALPDPEGTGSSSPDLLGVGPAMSDPQGMASPRPALKARVHPARPPREDSASPDPGVAKSA